MESLPTRVHKGRGGIRIWTLLLLALLLRVPGVYAQKPMDPREVMEELNRVTIDPTQVYVLRNAQITRDRVKFYFNRGFVAFFTKVSGEITGAVYSGEGEVLLIPPDLVEKRNLARFTQSPILEEQFTSVYMRFTDRTAEELLAVARRPDPDDSVQPSGFLEHWNPVAQTPDPDTSGRILLDLLGDRNFPLFHARIQGVNLPAFAVNYDERRAESVTVGSVQRQRDRLYTDLWCSFPSRTSKGHSVASVEAPVRVLSYKIDTRIELDHSLSGCAELLLESLSSADHVLTFELSRWLQVSDVKDEGGRSLVVFQNPPREESEAAARNNDWIQVVLPSPHPLGQKFRLVFTYQGSVIADVGNRVLYVGARGSWYPNRGIATPASYDLSFDYPEDLTLVATGARVEEKTSGGWTHSRWRSDGVFRVAGFNLGPYESVVRQVGKTALDVYATPEAEASLEKRHAAAQSPQAVVLPPRGDLRGPVAVIPGSVRPLAPADLLESVAESAAHAIEYFETLFGPFPYSRLALAQIPGSFGQGWPELVYLPTLSFLSRSTRSELGLAGGARDLLSQGVVAHEIAHQWWGNLLGWQTYHDQWLSEALATYAAALELSQEKDGERKFREVLRAYKRDLLSKTKSGASVESGGPIWLGQRLSNSLNPDGYETIVYKKACWVLHMLRGLMTDPKSGSDERFFRMLREFIVAYRGKSVSTQDFIRHAEKYGTRASDLEGNRKLDWFFNEWVFDTGIPTYTLESSTRRVTGQKFIVQGSIGQSGVPSGFEMLVPVVAVYGKDRKVTLGCVAVGDAGSRFRFTTTAKPTRITIDEDNLLAVVH